MPFALPMEADTLATLEKNQLLGIQTIVKHMVDAKKSSGIITISASPEKFLTNVLQRELLAALTKKRSAEIEALPTPSPEADDSYNEEDELPEWTFDVIENASVKELRDVYPYSIVYCVPKENKKLHSHPAALAALLESQNQVLIVQQTKSSSRLPLFKQKNKQFIQANINKEGLASLVTKEEISIHEPSPSTIPPAWEVELYYSH
jgi:hypothetical protein